MSKTSLLPAALATLMLCAAPGAGADHEWRPLAGAEIEEALSGRTLAYDFERQRFFASGRTSYDAGILEWGHWEVRDDRYCSLWPPAEDWTCYDVAVREGPEGREIRFSADGVEDSVGRVLK